MHTNSKTYAKVSPFLPIQNKSQASAKTNWICKHFCCSKIHIHCHLYFSSTWNFDSTIDQMLLLLNWILSMFSSNYKIKTQSTSTNNWKIKLRLALLKLCTKIEQKDIIECLYLIVWPLFRFLGAEISNFCVAFL